MQNLENILKDKFGLESFREGQLEIINSVINKNDTLVFMPTGGGKSLVYQFAGVYLKGIVIIISPLISLMKDQTDKLNELGIRTEVINSTISNFEKIALLDEISLNEADEKGSIKFLYIAPERLNDDYFLSIIKNVDIALIAIDEAHCISQWGHDFRPSYLKIKNFIEGLRKNKINELLFPIIALTATATKKVRADIIERLGIKNNNTFTTGFDRKNLLFVVKEISREQEKLEKVLEIIKKTSPYGIIYCSSKKHVSKVYQYLLEQGVNIGIYTGEMNGTDREVEQNNFMDSTYDVMVATNAFGMGIDKTNIRYVIHYNLPGSIENYYQEVGRAGRDGKMSYGIVLASYQDTKIQEFFIENSYPPKKDILALYDYFYKDFSIGNGSNHTILKTYNQIAIESKIGSDMKVGSIIVILEKYGILKRGYENDKENDFRGRGITLILSKMFHDKLPIIWSHQDLLKEEAYFKLEQIKNLLFKPGCRKKFILEYFQDEKDLKKIKNNCGLCDYCIEKKKFENTSNFENKEVIDKNSFFIILDFIKKFDCRFGGQVLAGVLTGSKEKKIIEWNLDRDKNYSILAIYHKEIVLAIFNVLIETGFLYKSFGEYPKIGITEKGIQTLYNNDILIQENNILQTKLHFKIKAYTNAIPKAKKNKPHKIQIEKIDTYTQTLDLFKKGMNLGQISKERGFISQTIEDHIIKLYTYNKITLQEIMKFSSLEKLKKIKEIISKNNLLIDKLKPIKEFCDGDIKYFDIKIAIAMIENKDL